MNVSDSERVATQLELRGYEMTSSEDSADVILFNTCSVREKAEHKLFTRVGQIHHSPNKDKVVGVMGCVAQLEGETLFQRGKGIDFILGTKAIGRVADAIETSYEENEKFIDLKDREFGYKWSTSATQRRSPYVAFVPIIEGCKQILYILHRPFFSWT